jgi:Acetoacetate decarboxylase (ADC)
MLKGFTSPLPPLGKATIVAAPPWHIAGDVIAFEFWTEPKAAAAILPPGLVPDSESEGRVIAAFADWQFTAQNEELLDPARYQCREFYIFVDARWNETPVSWVPYAFTDNDASLTRGWLRGSPKRPGSTFQTRTFPVPGPAAAAIAPGTRFGASLSVHGQRLANGHLALRRDTADVSAILGRPLVYRRYLPNFNTEERGHPVIDELVKAIHDDLIIIDVWCGDAQLEFPRAVGEELHEIAPIKVGDGYRFSMSCSIGEFTLLQDLRKADRCDDD